MGGRESSGSTRSSPVETIHRQVGNQAVQNGYAEQEYPEPAGKATQDGPQGTAMVDRGGPVRKAGVDGKGPLKEAGSAAGGGMYGVGVPGWQSMEHPR